MADIAPAKFNIDSTMEYISDEFRAELPGSQTLRGASTSDRVTLKMGLLDASNVPQLVTQMSGAVIDEYEAIIGPDSVIENIRGRDQGAFALDLTYKTLYRRAPVTEIISQVPPPPGTPPVPVKIGRFFASQIAKDACASVGLGLSWGCRDYPFLTDFNATGSVISILRLLTQPWNLVAPYKVDIYIQNSTVMIVPRSVSLGGATFSASMKDAKRSQLIIRKRPIRPYGLVTLRGQKVPTHIGSGGKAIPKTFSVSYPPAAPVGGERSSYDQIYRLPDNVLLFSQQSSYAQDSTGGEMLVSRVTQYMDWTAVQYDSQGRPLSQAQKLSARSTVERVDPSDPQKLLRTWELSNTDFGYDSDGFERSSTTIKQTLELQTSADGLITEVLNPSEMVDKTITPTGPLLADAKTTVYKWQSVDVGGGQTQFQWVFQRGDVSPQGGHPPGGPGRAQPTSITIPNPSKPSPQQGGATQIILTKQFLSNGLDVSYSNEHLTMTDLEFIMAQFAATYAIWEYEVEFAGVAQPWLQRGSTVQFTDVLVEDGTTKIPLPVLLITEVRSQYDESKPEASMLYKCRAFGYAGS